MEQLTEEQFKDIQEREKKALVFLKELNLTPAAQLSYENAGIEGKDVFVTRVQPYLQDTKFVPIKSPFPKL